ncbi:MAG: aquaporin [Elusimicrobiota bacterium]|jgi:aquaporin Z
MAGTLRALLTEFVGTFLWVSLGAGAVCADAMSGGRLGPVGVALAQGAAAAAAFAAFGRGSAGLLNPACTVALALTKSLPPTRALLCLVSQLLAAALAGTFLAAVVGRAAPDLLSTAPFLGAGAPALGYRAATLVEAVLAFFLAVLSRRAAEEGGAGAALAVGAFCASAALMAGGWTGALMNPARAFGPATATGYWTLHYVYWAGPLAGAFVGIAFSQWVLRRKT